MSGPGPSAVQQLSHDQPQVSPRKARDEVGQGVRREDPGRWESDVVDAEADVVDTLLTMRELASNTAGSDRLVQIAGGNQGGIRRESAEDDQGAHRSDSAPTGTAAGPTAAVLRDGFGSQRQPHNAAHGFGSGSRPNSGTASHALASRPNSFSGKKRKPVANEDEGVNGAGLAAPYRTGDARTGDSACVTESETAALQLQQQLTIAAAAAEALAWRQGATSASGGQAGAPPVAVGRVASEPLINGGQRLPEVVLARLGLGSLGPAAGDAAAVERLRALVLGSVASAGNGNGNGPAAADQLPSAKRPHVLSRQTSAVGMAMAAAAAAAASGAGGLSLSAEDLQQLAQQQQQQQQPGTGAATAAERANSGRQDWTLGSVATPAPASTGPVISVKMEHGAEPEAQDGATVRVAPLESPTAAVPDQHIHGGMSRGPGARAGRRCTPPSPLGHHSDTGSDSGSPSARAPYSPARTGVTHASEPQPSRAGAAAAAAATADAATAAAAPPPPGAGSPEGDEPTAPAGPARTSSVISLLHMLAIRQQQQQQQQRPTGPAVQGRGGAAPPLRGGETAEMLSGGEGMTVGERPGRGPRDWERERDMADPRVGGLSREQQVAAAAAAATGMHVDGGAGAALYGSGRSGQHGRGGGGAAALQREMSYNSREHLYIGGGVPADMMQVDETSSMPRAPHRTLSETAEAQQAAAGLHAAVNARAAAAAAAAAVAERNGTDFDMASAGAGAGVPYNGNGMAATGAAAGAGDERIHASLAAIERKLLLQEERLVYELKQVRLMQKLLHVQQMKQMVREAMRGKDRDGTGAVAAAAAAVLGAEGLMGSASPFQTPEMQAATTTNGPAGDIGDPGLARLASLPVQLLAAFAARAAAVGGGGGGGLAREMSGVEVLRTSSDASAVAAAALHHGSAVEQPLAPHGYQQLHGKAPYQQRRVRSEAPGDADGAGGAPQEEGWSALGADGGGRLLSYIAALSNGKGAAEVRQGPSSGPQAHAAAAAALLAAARREAGPPLGGNPFAAIEVSSPRGHHRAPTGGGDAFPKGAIQAAGRGAAVYEVADLNGAEAALGGVVPSEEEAALLQARLVQALLKHGRHPALQDQMMASVALNGGSPEGTDAA